MVQSVYVTSLEADSGKSTVAIGLMEGLAGQGRVAPFRPVVASHTEPDTVLEVLLEQTSGFSYEECIGVTYDEVHTDPETAHTRIIERYRRLAGRADSVVVLGSDYTGPADTSEFDLNVDVAANIGAAIVLVVSALGREVAETNRTIELAVADATRRHGRVAGLVVNRVAPDHLDAYTPSLDGSTPVWTLPEVTLLASPTVGEILTELGAEVVSGDPELFAREAESMLVAGMNVPHVLERLREGQLVISASDRQEMLVALVAAHAAESFPSLSGVVLYGGYETPEVVERLVGGFGQHLPVLATPRDSFATASIASRVRPALTTASRRKIEVASQTFRTHVPIDQLQALLATDHAPVVTPLMFEAELLERARTDRKRIVLPEGEDDRILKAAALLLERDVADLTILGEEASILARAAELGLDLSGAQVLSLHDPELLDRFADEYAHMRSHKGMTPEQARPLMEDCSYFGTMMVHLGLADGMVSGATHTTAHTIRPSFEIIRTQPGTSIVSSVFLMLMSDRVLVFGDCAVNPAPTAEQLADIAISSAQTAAGFGVEPRVAMLSYSTGSSGSGADVDRVREATRLVRERAPQLAVEGPIQYDAAVDPTVALAKLPDSDVAGRATVLIFPDLNTGNNTYKAVQRSAGAVAVGPVLQGLNKPVNDLSRGALVHDIVNTVAITAVQAQVLAAGA
ncbi:phosphate acetyltransferase [Raineyella antarctica]|uniref:Phosphate acetyltransferase n=1 Tax=Raineyella antarctica TaxID=1577474 RepID=A0A1G6GGL3_9ACTN|nr:phosphate acetyltransferase [Raineyella antarctica]SDB80316.1 phosphate acetyltransferase [Raineyella antarctica]